MSQNNFQKAGLIIAGVMFVVVSVTTGYQWAKHSGEPSNTTESSTQQQNSGRKVLYWYDPMSPAQHFDKPGKSPYMDMELQPKYADENVAQRSEIHIDTNIQQNLGIRLVSVERRPLTASIDAVATVEFNQRELTVLQARTNGFVSRVYARAAGDVIARGAPLVDLLVPEWAGAQQEFIALRANGDARLINAMRERLHLLGMPDELVDKIERTGLTQTSVTITSPQSGVIKALNVQTGVTVSVGMTLAEINGLDTVWLSAAVPEALAQQVAVGNMLEARFPAFAGQMINGKIIAILPETNSDNRTLTVRAELPNPDGRLRPGQFAHIALKTARGDDVLTVPSEAIIRTGMRTVVIVANSNQFIPVEVETGRETDDRTEILKGLQEGEQVVASGQFLIDSEANLTGVLSRMLNGASHEPAMNEAIPPHQHSAMPAAGGQP